MRSTTSTDVPVLSPCSMLQALIAGGTFTGEVYVWDMSKEGDPQVRACMQLWMQ